MYDDPIKANMVKDILESNGVIAGVMGDSIANTLMMHVMKVFNLFRFSHQASQ